HTPMRDPLVLKALHEPKIGQASHPMSPGFQRLHPGGMLIPEGCVKIAHRFNDGLTIGKGPQVPGGTEELASRFSFAPFGAGSVHDTLTQAINRWAIFGRPCGTGTARVFQSWRIILLVLCFTSPLIAQPVPDGADHAALIQKWDEQSLARGEKLYAVVCITCHGTPEQQGTLPTSRA